MLGHLVWMCVACSLSKDVDVAVWFVDGGPLARTLYAVSMPRWTYDLDQTLHSMPYLVIVKLLERLQFWNRLDTKPSNVKEESVGHTPRVLVQGRKNSRRRTPSRIPLYSY
jgi:hypothetical protein